MWRRLCAIDFMFVWSNPKLSLSWLHQALIILVGSLSVELCTTLPMNVSYRVAIFCLMFVISKNIFLTVSFVMPCSLTSFILMSIMRWIPRCRNNTSLLRRDMQSAHISYTHKSSLVGMARNANTGVWTAFLEVSHWCIACYEACVYDVIVSYIVGNVTPEYVGMTNNPILWLG